MMLSYKALGTKLSVQILNTVAIPAVTLRNLETKASK